MIYFDIKNFSRQFSFQPKIENGEKLKKKFSKFLVAGMGGSHLAADILQCWQPELDFIVWPNYGLPPHAAKDRLFIASSYSGNTEETIDAFWSGRKRGLTMAVMASGGKLLEIAHRTKTPYVELPKSLQPRMSTGFGLRAILKLIGDAKGLAETQKLANTLKSQEFAGKKLAKTIQGKSPIIYSSLPNMAIARNWKIKFNETGKIPAFWNVFPELNHNEMTGFDAKPTTKKLSQNFAFLVLEDKEDDPRVIRRMKALARLYKKRGLQSVVVVFEGNTRLIKIFSSLNLADWAAYYTARQYNVNPEQVPMVEEFKIAIGNNK